MPILRWHGLAITNSRSHRQRVHGESDQWFGARRNCAEQGSPGVRTGYRDRLKGVMTMVRDVFSWAWSHRSAALVALGWIAFVLGSLASPVWARLMLLTASRVLPQAACLE